MIRNNEPIMIYMVQDVELTIKLYDTENEINIELYHYARIELG